MGPLATLATQRRPFFFISDFLGSDIRAYPLEVLEKEAIRFSFRSDFEHQPHNHQLKVITPSYESYKKRFDKIIDAIKRGETYVLNFTHKTEIKTPLSLDTIYSCANAKFKLQYKDQFVCFSPEPFITIEGDTISTFPMKGTIDAALPDAKERILNDAKEHAEHTMIVDLLRNDLSQIASKVQVKRFRYTEEIAAGDKRLIQVSSHISGKLPDDWHADLDTIITKLLPAGSISGAPKKSTVEHILDIESYERGFFSGVMGYFDGAKLQTAVMIRFIEKEPDGRLFYKSGGGITIDSDPRKEFQEMLDKIYIP